ncbi:hypothetical protein FSP39_008269 [Pinctada imbricata]|uniref:Protein rolling stone-like n=1 Tax=Pinctada imbricata TaxID=66713 RepID=A0AA88YLL6_PINIB|nr:hypothetical protein FSP39_008269 [Pinctada imbricata]
MSVKMWPLRPGVSFNTCTYILQFGLPIPYLIWRIFWALYHVVWIILSGVYSWQWAGHDPAQQIKWFIYLTDWCYFVLTVATLVDAVSVVYVLVRRKDISKGECETMSWYLQVNWVLFNVANSSALLVSLLYWGLIYGPNENMTAVNIETHALNSVYVIINVLVTAVPIRLYHFFHGVIYAITYVLFTLIYYLAGGTNEDGKPYVYSTIDWRDTGFTVGLSLAVTFVAMPVVHTIFWALYKLRVFLFSKCSRNSDSVDIPMNKLP